MAEEETSRFLAGKYASAAVALLAALLELEDTYKPVPMRRLVDRAQQLLESGRRFKPVSQLADAPASCGAWSQIVPLEGSTRRIYVVEGPSGLDARQEAVPDAPRGASPAGALKFVKRRSRKAMEGGLGFELTDAGRAAAADLARSRRGTGGAAAGPLRAWGGSAPADVIVVVDDREGGGDKHHLPALARLLRDQGAPFEA